MDGALKDWPIPLRPALVIRVFRQMVQTFFKYR